MNTKNIESFLGINMLYTIKDHNISPLEWALKNKEEVQTHLEKTGALLIRGFEDIKEEDFGTILSLLFGGELIDYTFRSTPRTELKNKIYTATEYHHTEWIPQHNENAYSNKWPSRIGLVCKIKAEKMGNTPISDSRIAYNQIPAEIRDEFEKKNIMYVRNYSNIIDLPWEEVFQTNNRSEIEAYCKGNNILAEWTPNGLRTKQINNATLVHPNTKDKLWFNQAHLFHISNLNSELREDLTAILGEDNLPRNTYFGDGTSIDPEVLDIIRDVYNNTKVSFDWLENDLLLLDNMLYTHGREPFEGKRKVLVGMAREHSAS
ncbi:TauD/TfdA family dioxygenase [Tenacibaculum piscium]|uniref:TauD/TfdA family dioxygenase n=1 Tax=Tenacibaculum piscium TaxID=1458515 RepID=UPI001F3AAE0E|nr:TauD/TfdA family dioxygenase [Tenacibaculum piscium]